MNFFKKVKEIRSRKGELHFQRYAIFECDMFALYIHKIYKKDEDDHLHDHPWNFLGVVLKGAYVESLITEGLAETNLRFPMSAKMIRARGYYHKIASIVKGPVTTLVIRVGGSTVGVQHLRGPPRGRRVSNQKDVRDSTGKVNAALYANRNATSRRDQGQLASSS